MVKIAFQSSLEELEPVTESEMSDSSGLQGRGTQLLAVDGELDQAGSTPRGGGGAP